MRSFLGILAIAICCYCPASPWGQEARVIRGTVLFVDENNCPNRPVGVYFEIDVELSVIDLNIKSGHKAPVRNDCTFVYDIPDELLGKNVMLKPVWQPPELAWSAPPDEQLVKINLGVNMREYGATVTIIRPKDLGLPQRRRLMTMGKNELDKGNIEKAQFLLGEASRGNNLDYVVEAVNLLDKKDCQYAALPMLKALDVRSLQEADLTKFRLYMRTGTAAKAARNAKEALAAFGEAQAIFPHSEEPMSFAYTVVHDALTADGLSPTPFVLDRQADLRSGFLNVYLSWAKTAKPKIAFENPDVSLAWTFAGEHCIEIKPSTSVQKDELTDNGK